MGYRDTITAAFARLVRATVGPASRADDPPRRFRRDPELFDRSVSALLRHYDRASWPVGRGRDAGA